jgi:hypothetical protein
MEIKIKNRKFFFINKEKFFLLFKKKNLKNEFHNCIFYM